MPVNVRTAVRDTCLPAGGGPDGESRIHIRAGTDVEFCLFAMQRSLEHWGEDADEFRPERWIERTASCFKKEGLSPTAYAPFSEGPRACLGRQLISPCEFPESAAPGQLTLGDTRRACYYLGEVRDCAHLNCLSEHSPQSCL